MSLNLLLAAYLCGGVTLPPLVLFCFFIYGLVVFPRRDEYSRSSSGKASPSSLVSEQEDDTELKEKLKSADRGSDVAAGYFAVCREYVPAGVNGKPPERTTPAGETIAAESPSVYQSMYRSIFDRNKSQGPSIEAGKSVKRARNVFYVVLRHGHLMLFDNSDQLEVRHVIALTHYDVDIYGGDVVIPEGELYIKRNSIRLLRRIALENATANLAPFYLFSDNCSEKEDFYHALLQSQRKFADSGSEWPDSQEFDTEDMIKLVRQLHLPEENNQNRWLNALMGRVFLALYKTNNIEKLVRNKITKKISRVQKPAFITSLTLEDVGMGESAPTFANLKLKEVTVDGNMLLETDVKYSGKFRAVVAAVAKLDLGQRFKAREVDLVLAGDLRRLEGHMLIRIKPAPSNRIWFSFESMPKMEMAIEPIVSTRQITYGVIIRAIESRIREVFGETLVYPNWDDIPFTDTKNQQYRGGIWKSKPKPAPSLASTVTAGKDDLGAPEEEPAPEPLVDQEAVEIVPKLHIPQSASTHALLESERTAADGEGLTQSPLEATPTIPMPRSNSYASPATASPAIVTKIPVMSNKARKISDSLQSDAANAMKSLRYRSQDGSPMTTPSRLPRTSPVSRTQSSEQSAVDTVSNPEDVSDTQPGEGIRVVESDSVEPDSRVEASPNQESAEVAFSPEDIMSPDTVGYRGYDRKSTMNQNLMSATAAAKKWGLEMMQRNRETMTGGKTSRLPRNLSTTEPMGRGQPLPPPGEPLPGPAEQRGWTTGALGSLKRKPVAQSTNSTPTSPHQKSTSISSISSLSTYFTGTSNKETEKKTNSAEMIHDEPGQLDLVAAPPSPDIPSLASPSPSALGSHPTNDTDQEELSKPEPKTEQNRVEETT